MNPLCLDQGVGLIPWSPLARGFLVGNRFREGGGPTRRANSDLFAQDMYYQPEDFEIVDRVVQTSSRLGISPAQVALTWLLHKPGVAAPIIGARRVRHLDEAVAATETQLSAEDMQLLEELYQPHPVLGHS